MKLTLSALVKILIEEFIPDIHHKYLLQNYKTSSAYRSYNDIVPPYLHDCPHSVIRTTYIVWRGRATAESLMLNQQNGIFIIKGSSENIYTVNFGGSSGEPSCSCFDWTKWNIPLQALFCYIQAYSQLDLELFTL